MAAGLGLFQPRLHERFDLIGMDPRGVALSTHVRCDPAVFNRPVSLFPATAAEFQQLSDYARDLGSSEQTPNQILTEMDGFDPSIGVVVLSATNRPVVIDPALLRPGRFDRRIAIQPPDTAGRHKILAVHTRSVPLGDDVDLDRLAATTPGMVGADLANVVNEAALLAAGRDRLAVTRADFEDALEKLILGTERRILLSPAERRRTAYHEAGHAIVAMLTAGADPVRKVSIIPRGVALGVTLSAPEADRFSYDRPYLIGKIKVALGGRVAEEIAFGEVTTGAQQDIKEVTQLARRMAGQWGMSEAIGPLAVLPEDGPLPYPGAVEVAPDTVKRVDDEVKRIVDDALDEVRALLAENRERLDGLAAALLGTETLGAEEAYAAAGLPFRDGSQARAGGLGSRGLSDRRRKAARTVIPRNRPGGVHRCRSLPGAAMLGFAKTKEQRWPDVQSRSVSTASARRAGRLRLSAGPRGSPAEVPSVAQGVNVLTRRQLLQRGAAGGAGLMLARTAPAASKPPAGISPPLTKFVDPLPVPPMIDLTGGGSRTLPMAPGSHRFHAELGPAATFGYGGASYLGPTLLVRRDVPVALTFPNRLGAHPLARSIDTSLDGALAADRSAPRASVHVHGGLNAPRFDGHPQDTYLPGASKTYEYLNRQEAGTVWYHDHALGITRLNVYAGLAGYYLVRDQFDTGLVGNPLGLPAPYGTYEIPLALQDKSFEADGALLYDPSPWVPEFFGDVPVVNGKAWPNLDVDRGLYRFRIVNGSSARFYNLRLSSGQPFIQIGTDGGLLNAPVTVRRLLLAPGERADVLIDFSRLMSGRRVVLTNDAVTPFPSGSRSRRKGALPIRELMRFTVGSRPGFRGAVPATLRGGAGQPPRIAPPGPAATVRHLPLVEILDPTGAPLKVLLNNLHFDTANIETPRQGTTEIWNLINLTADTHPIHLHLVQFRILERRRFDVAAYLAAYNPGLPSPSVDGQGPWPAPSADAFARGAARAPARNEQGFKDTIRANPGEITRVVARFPTASEAGFDPDAPYTNAAGQTIRGYVWHCHILEHEDNEMMLRYRVVA